MVIHLLHCVTSRESLMRVQFVIFSSSFCLLYVLTHFLGVCVINFWCFLLFDYIFSCTSCSRRTAHTHARWKSWGVSFSATSASHRTVLGNFVQKYIQFSVRSVACFLLCQFFCSRLPYVIQLNHDEQRTWVSGVMGASHRWLKGDGRCQHANPKFRSGVFIFHIFFLEFNVN